MNKLCVAFLLIMGVCASIVFAQAGDHFAEGTIASISDAVIVLTVSDGESINLIIKDFTSYEQNQQQVPLTDLVVGMSVRVAYYDYADSGKDLTHLYVLSE